MSWRGRRLRRLGPCSVTHHALDSYLSRVPGVTVHEAREKLQILACQAKWHRHTWSGCDVYRIDGLELVVHRIARRIPVLVTVTYRGGTDVS
jgi:hypothetical protein